MVYTKIMNQIDHEYVRVASMKFAWGAAEYFGHKHKNDREWEILGAMTAILKYADCSPIPVYAEKQECPDFRLFNSSRSLITECEVTQVLRPGYARHAHHKEDAKNPSGSITDVDPIDDQWQPITDILKKKTLRSYIENSWLLIHYSIASLETYDWDTPFHDRLLSELSTNMLQLNLADFAKFRRILVLGNDMRSLTEIHPLQIHVGNLPKRDV